MQGANNIMINYIEIDPQIWAYNEEALQIIIRTESMQKQNSEKPDSTFVQLLNEAIDVESKKLSAIHDKIDVLVKLKQEYSNFT